MRIRSASYVNENVKNTLVKKLKKSTYLKDRTFLFLYLKLKNANKNLDEKYTDKN